MRLISALVFSVIFLVGCGSSRDYLYLEDARGVGTYTTVVIDAPTAEYEALLSKALSPYFDISTRGDVRVKHIEATSLIVQTEAERGAYGANISIRKFGFRGGHVISEIREHSRLGGDAAIRKAIVSLDDLCALLSERTQHKSVAQ